MPYEISWLLEPRIVEIKIIGLFTLAELKEADAKGVEMVRTHTNQSIHFFFDLTKMTYSPPLSAMRAIQLLQTPNLGWCVNYGTFNPLFRVMTLPLSKIFGIKQRFFNRRDEALRFLQNADTTLPSLSQNEVR